MTAIGVTRAIARPVREALRPDRPAPEEWWVPLLLFGLCVGGYGLVIQSLGFYWDDWPGMWVAHSLSPSELRAYIAFDRPLSGQLFSLTAPLLGVHPLNAHLFALLLRWSIAVAMWWMMRGVWPARHWEAAALGMLTAVYPGCSQQSISWITSQGIYIPFLICLFSLGAMVWSVRRPSYRALAAPAWLGSILHLLLMEYFFGLELLRPVLLWVALGEEPAGHAAGGRLRRFLRIYWPYGAGTAAVLFWRIFLFRSARSATDQVALLQTVADHPAKQIVMRLESVLNDLLSTTVMAWTHAAGPYLLKSETSMVWLIGLAVLTVTSLICAFWLRRRFEPADGVKWSGSAVAVAALAVVLAGIPVWVANREVVLGEVSDRYSLAPMFGACLLFVALARRMLRTRAQQAAVLALLAGIGAAYQYRTGERYARDWSAQRALLWQLSWRAPHLRPGTSILLTDESVISPKSDYAASIPVNLLYAPGRHSTELPYWVFHLPTDLALGKPQARTLTFHGTPNLMINAQFPAKGCLQVTAASGDPIIEAPAATPPAAIFGPEPAHGWCYFYEKAELARAAGDWATVARLGDEAHARRLSPSNPAEWQPFAEAYRQLGREPKAPSEASLR